jgi:hypothetical protein
MVMIVMIESLDAIRGQLLLIAVIDINVCQGRFVCGYRCGCGAIEFISMPSSFRRAFSIVALDDIIQNAHCLRHFGSKD